MFGADKLAARAKRVAYTTKTPAPKKNTNKAVAAFCQTKNIKENKVA